MSPFKNTSAEASFYWVVVSQEEALEAQIVPNLLLVARVRANRVDGTNTQVRTGNKTL
jgi:hypothetical protein